LSRPRELSKLFSTSTALATDSELAGVDLTTAIITASTASRIYTNSASASLIAYTNNATPDLTPAIRSASAAAVAYTDSQIANINLSSTIITASAAAASYADNLVTNLAPIISGIAPDNISGTASTALIINGQNFKSGSIVKLVNNSSTELFTLSTTFNNARSLQILTPFLTASAGPYDIKVTNPDNQISILENALNIGNSPIWSTPSGSLGNIFDYARSSQTFSLTASDPENQTVTYSLVDGSFPVGLSLSPNGTISGSVSGVASDTTYAFTIRASDSVGSYTDRGFSLTVKAPYVHSFTTVGSTNWVAPSSGSIRVLIIGGGGGGGHQVGGGGGGGGFVEYTSYAVTAGQVYPVVVGGGGLGGTHLGQPTGTAGSAGGNSSFDGKTAFGGGGGGSHSGGSATSGGSGGGGGGGGSASNNGAASNQTTPAGASTVGGNAGGVGRSTDWAGGGGGGAGGGGISSPSANTGGQGGIGRTSNITGVSLYYAGGGGGCNNTSNTLIPGGLGGGGRGVGNDGQAVLGTQYGDPGTNGLGGGGGGCRDFYATPYSNATYYIRAGDGGSGVVILRY
jgi:hypothetical protein